MLIFKAEKSPSLGKLVHHDLFLLIYLHLGILGNFLSDEIIKKFNFGIIILIILLKNFIFSSNNSKNNKVPFLILIINIYFSS